MNKLIRLILIIIPFIILGVFFWEGRDYNPAYFNPPTEKQEEYIKLLAKISGWTLSDLQWFPEDRVFEKINGRAALYKQFGVVGLLAGEWEKNGVYWSMYLYEMKNKNAVKGIYLAEMPDAKQKLVTSDQYYLVKGGLTVQSGNYYLQLISADVDGKALSVTGLAAAVLSELSGGKLTDNINVDSPLEIIKDKIIPGSEGYSAESAFGYAAFSGVNHVL